MKGWLMVCPCAIGSATFFPGAVTEHGRDEGLARHGFDGGEDAPVGDPLAAEIHQETNDLFASSLRHLAVLSRVLCERLRKRAHRLAMRQSRWSGVTEMCPS